MWNVLLSLSTLALSQGTGPAPVPLPVAHPGGALALGAGCAPAWQPGLSGSGLDGGVPALAVFDDGSGASLFVSGLWQTDGVPLRLARWDGTSWSRVGDFTAFVSALEVVDLGAGEALYAGGFFNTVDGQAMLHVSRWDGASWSPLGTGTLGPVRAMTRFDDGTGPALYVAGEFAIAGGQPAARIARWDGASWSGLGGGLPAGTGSIQALCAFDDGSGPALYVGGSFNNAGGSTVAGLARWDGLAWSDVGGGVASGYVNDLAVFDDGSGPALYVGGTFQSAGGVSARGVARWDGSSWSAVGGGVQGSGVLALEVHDDGSGPALYAGGGLTSAGGRPVSGVARWDGLAWRPLGAGLPNDGNGVRALAGAPAPLGPALFAGGDFLSSPGGGGYLARWACGPGSGAVYCFGDGSGAPCPCGNGGGPGEGCANGTGGGATLSAGGSASVSAGDLVLQAGGLPPSQPGLYFQGLARVNGGAGAPFGDGLRCAGQGVVRLQTTPADASGAAATTVDIALTGGVSAGDTRAYQLWYRDPTGSPCSARFNLTNGLELDWLP